MPLNCHLLLLGKYSVHTQRCVGMFFLSLREAFTKKSRCFSKKVPMFFQKRLIKKQKIADLSFYFEFQVVVAVVGFKWHS